MTVETDIEIVSGAEIEIPLNKLKKSPRNARKVPHAQAAIEALAASIGAKKMLQKPVVEPERDAEGGLTGSWLVTIGEGRRLALRLLAQRKQIKKTHPVLCTVDTEFDPQEISLDENVTRSAMHPADQFEAFRDQAERRGLGAEEIGARFGVSAQIVRQRLRLGAVSPKLMAVYREDGLTLDQLMAFAVSEDHERQEQVFESLSYNRSANFIRRAMTEAKVEAHDRRAVFVGIEAYAEAGGAILRDLFTEDGGGWLEDVVLLERLAHEKLSAMALDVRDREGWKWAEAHLDYPSGHGLARVYPHKVERTPEQQGLIDAICAEYDALTEQYADVEDLPPDIEARLKEIDTALEALGDGYAYDPDELARGGVFVILNHDGTPRVERGLVRAEDLAPEPDPDAVEPSQDAPDPSPGDAAEPEPPVEEDAPEDELAPLSDRLVAELSAYRTASLRDALAENPEIALLGVVHALALRVFYPGAVATCLDIRAGSRYLVQDAPGIEDAPACRRIDARHEAWARQLPVAPEAVWAFVLGLDTDSRMALFAHCVGFTADAVQAFPRRPQAQAQADDLATRLSLDMARDWTATARSYLGRVTKGRVLEAVSEAAGEDAAARLKTLRKTEMVEAAEPLIAGTDWLPPLLRRASAVPPDAENSAPVEVAA
ncbi:ParB/RepB/Spo0J family partition protein [Phenylobacterium sp.]|uniref:ParB/RepB/Spo0J family partition protein n=1 Tax=Phenylobacterium sp. TaxID=1871053 RepID=UPI002FCB207A